MTGLEEVDKFFLHFVRRHFPVCVYICVYICVYVYVLPGCDVTVISILMDPCQSGSKVKGRSSGVRGHIYRVLRWLYTERPGTCVYYKACVCILSPT